jgi:hypothetical protein
MIGEKFGFVHFLTDFEIAPAKKMTGEKFGFFQGCERAIELFA